MSTSNNNQTKFARSYLKGLIPGLVLGIVVGFACIPFSALAAREGGARDVDLNQSRREARITLTKIEGQLICSMGDANNGQGCDLKIKETKTGKVFALVNKDQSQANDLMRLYQSNLAGSNTISIEGSLVNGADNTIRVNKAEAL